jgi:N-acetylglucosaminyl-diphospho-decaprenol L-rhamnosyltransferase
VAVVSWNTRDLLAQCLGSLHVEVDQGRAAVWVVDNASSDGSAELVRREAPWATLVESDKNLGFGGAVDLVAERTDSPWLAPANADIALEPGALGTLLNAATDARTAVVAPRLVLPDGRTQHSVYHFPTVPFTIAFNLGLLGLSRRLGDRFCLEGRWDPDRPRTVDWAVGAFLLVRRSAFDAVGGFDARQWMYAEDLDLGWRLADAGYCTRYEPRAAVRHHQSAATSAAFGEEKMARFMKGTYAVLARRRGAVHARATATVNCLGAAVRAGTSRRERRDLNRRWLAAHRYGLQALKRQGDSG